MPTIERAILDFQLTLLGIQTQRTELPVQGANSERTIERLTEIAQEFEELLNGDINEETLQVFLKKHPFVLHPAAEAIPKKKLGEDFVTDFVLVSTSAQGPTYILVELERASHAILTKDLALASPVNHAIKQTRDWDVWLEENKAYLRSKLPGFETPKYLVVIGRGNKLDEKSKAYLRSYNREWKNMNLLTYDDVLANFRNTISSLNGLLLSADAKN